MARSRLSFVSGLFIGTVVFTAIAPKTFANTEIQSYVESYINHRLASSPWRLEPPWKWAISDFKVIGQESFNNRDYLVGKCDWGGKEQFVDAVVGTDPEGQRACAWYMSPISESSEPIHWALFKYSKHAAVVTGTVLNRSINKVKVYFSKPQTLSEVPVHKNGFFFCNMSVRGGSPQGVWVEGLDSSNRVIFSPPHAQEAKKRFAR